MRLAFLFMSLHMFFNVFSDEVIWKGKVNSDGTPTELIELELHQEYYVKASGYVNLGKWVQGGEKLANDACYEFNKEHSLSKVETLKNSNGISLCHGEYQPNHIYFSSRFKANHDRIFFWVNDTTYEDNSGELEVEVIKASSDKNPF